MSALSRARWLARQVGPVELAARLRLALLKKTSRGWHGRSPAGVEARTVFTAMAQGLEALRAAGLREPCAAEADEVLDGRFTLFEAWTHEAGAQAPDWLGGLPEGPRWDDGYSFDIDISGGHGRDVRFTWELSRHGDLAALARAAFLTGDARYRQRLELLLSDWIAKNPLLRGPNWISALEVALRAITWCLIDDAAPLRDGSSRGEFLRVLFRHGLFVQRFNSFHLNPSNHIIGEAASLFILGCKFGGTSEGRLWRARARRLLEDEIIRQTYPSGASREHSLGYHRFVTGLFSLCLAVSNEGEFSARFRKRLEAMYAFLAQTIRPDGSIPDIGDRDDAVALRLSDPARTGAPDDLSVGAALFPDAAFASCAPRAPSPQALWLFGERAVAGSGGCISAGGSVEGLDLAVMRSPSGRLQVEFDRGRHGYNPVASHGHADALSVTLWHRGDRLIDPGTYRYNGAHEWRRAFRSGAFHNTLSVDGAPLAAPATSFRWLTLADASPAGAFFSEEFDWAAAVLEPGKGRPWRHTREVLRVGKGPVIIIDRVHARGAHRAEARFHFGDADISLDDNAARVSYGDDGFMSIAAAAGGVEWTRIEGEGAARSSSYGLKLPAAAVKAAASFRDDALLPWLLTFEADAEIERLQGETGAAIAARIADSSGEYVFMCRRDIGVVHLGAIRFVGRWALVKLAGGRAAAAWGADAWVLEDGGRRLFTGFGGLQIGRMHPADGE